MAVLFALIAANAVLTPNAPYPGTTALSECRWAIINFVYARAWARASPWPTGGSWLVQKAADDHWAFSDLSTPSDPKTVHVVVTWEHRTLQTGVWSPIVETAIDSITCREPDSLVECARDQEDRRAILALIHAKSPEFLAGRRPSSYDYWGRSVTRILWLGVLNDLFVLSLFIALVFSFRLNLQRMRERRASENPNT